MNKNSSHRYDRPLNLYHLQDIRVKLSENSYF